MDIMNKIIKLDDGNDYVMLESTEYNGTTYYLGNDVVDGHLGNDIAIFKIIKENEKMKVVLEPNIEICEKVITQINAKIEN